MLVSRLDNAFRLAWYRCGGYIVPPAQASVIVCIKEVQGYVLSRKKVLCYSMVSILQHNFCLRS